MKKTKSEAALTRVAILNAAELIFYRKGVKASSLAEIATQAGVTRGALYWHFRRKADLLLELFASSYLVYLQALIKDDTVDVQKQPVFFIESKIVKWLGWLAAEPRLKRQLAILLRTNGFEDYHELHALVKELDDREDVLMEFAFRRADEIGHLGKGHSPEVCFYTTRSLLKGLQLEVALSSSIDDVVANAKKSVKSLISSYQQDVPH